MKRIMILILLSMIVATGVYATDLCKDEVEVNTSCRLATPSLSCSVYNYTIYNVTGQSVENGTLQNLNDSIYYLNFSQERGFYLVRLCDGGVREIYVGESIMTSGSFTGLVGIIAVAIFIITLLYFAFKLDEEHSLLQMLLIFICVSMFVLIGYISTTIEFAGSQIFFNATLFLFTIFTIYIFVKLVYKATVWLKSVVPK